MKNTNKRILMFFLYTLPITALQHMPNIDVIYAHNNPIKTEAFRFRSRLLSKILDTIDEIIN